MTTTDHNKVVHRLLDIFRAAIRPTGREHLEAPAAGEI